MADEAPVEQPDNQAPNAKKTGKKKVAVLVVHGVAAKAARQSLDQVTDMLTSYRPPEPGSVYVRIGKTEFPLSVSETDVQNLVKGAEGRDQPFDRGLMNRMLRSYKTRSWEKFFKLERNEVRRLLPAPASPEDCPDIHLYECFWADLSRGGMVGFFTKFVEFYQFLLDLCGLGRKSLYFASRAHSFYNPLWWLMRFVQSVCEFVITGTIPALNVLLIAVLVFAPVVCQGPDFQRWFFPVCIGFYVLLRMPYIIGPFSKLPSKSVWRRNWVIWATLIGIVIGCFSTWVFDAPPENIFRTIGLATGVGWCALVGLLWWWALEIYEMRWRLALNICFLTPITVLVVLWAIGHHPHPASEYGMRTLLKLSEVLMALGQLSWFSFFELTTVLILLSSFSIWFGSNGKLRAGWPSANIRALHTLQFSTSLAGLLILLVTLCAWQIVPYIIVNTIKLSDELGHDGNNSAAYPIVSCWVLKPIIQSLAQVEGWLTSCIGSIADGMDGWVKWAKQTCYSSPISHHHVWSKMLHQIGNQLFPFSCKQLLTEPPSVVNGVSVMLNECNYNQIYFVVLALIAALVMTCLAFKPVIDIEINPLAKPSLRPTGKTAPKKSGGTLDEAFYSLRRIGAFVTWIITAVTSVSFIVLEILSDKYPDWEPLFRSPLAFPGFLVICGVVLLVAIAKLFGPILAVTLDVINWLRELPKDNTPRARIVARLLAMLDAVAWAHETHNYDQLIIVAHSQGTVITVETLRALKASSEIQAFLRRRSRGLPKMTLFTMGSPLRQLYACRFPHLFAWVDDPPTGTAENCPNPDPGALFQIKQWVNAYGSMDYVGRALWHRHSDGVGGLPVGRRAYWDNRAIEVCLGEMAHTHYWDHGSIIAQFLDEIIETGSFAPKEPAHQQVKA